MCIISERVKAVAKTKILIAPDVSGTRQLTVYSNAVDNISPNNAMILPVPNPKTIKFHDLSKYKNIFNDCNKSFFEQMTRGSLFLGHKSKSSNLYVFDVGSYKVSLAMGIEDLTRVDKTVFSLSDGCYKMMIQEYSDPVFGFVICKLKTGREEYHPLGYSHEIHKNKLFIPTKHYHAHGPIDVLSQSTRFDSFDYDASNIDDSPMFGSGLHNLRTKFHPMVEEDWAHEIYLYNGTNKSNPQFMNMVKSNERPYEYWTGEHLIRTELIDFEFPKLLHFEKHAIFGNQTNIDLDAIIDINPNNKIAE